MKISRYIFILGLIFLLMASCNTDEFKLPSDKDYQENGETISDSGTNGNGSVEQYYFEFSNLSPIRIETEAGSTQIYFKCNQEYSVSVSGNIKGLRVSPTSGEGSGSVLASYNKVEYKEGSSYITWNESGTIIFTVKEGPKNNYKIVCKEFTLSRIGSKIKL